MNEQGNAFQMMGMRSLSLIAGPYKKPKDISVAFLWMQ
jgi:hypothetical protein